MISKNLFTKSYINSLHLPFVNIMRKWTLLFLAVFSLVYATAQTADLRGFVYDKETGEPIIFCNVILEGTTIGASTDVNGFFSITNIPIGNHTVFITYIGYDTLIENISQTLLLQAKQPCMQ